MIRIAAFAFLAFSLSACGADGPPERPEPKPAAGLSVSGTVEIGVTGGG